MPNLIRDIIMNSCCHFIGGQCTVLTCECYPKCSFRSTEAEVQKKVEKAWERIRSLPMEKQETISTKYYNEEMPWLNGIIG